MQRSGGWVKVSMGQRANFREELAKAGIRFTETKSFWSSVFRIDNDTDYRLVAKSLRDQGLI